MSDDGEGRRGGGGGGGAPPVRGCLPSCGGVRFLMPMYLGTYILDLASTYNIYGYIAGLIGMCSIRTVSVMVCSTKTLTLVQHGRIRM
jgi:hypothetical protein